MAAPGYKAAAAAKCAAVAAEGRGLPVWALDSGFEFDCLNGEPGANTQRVLKGMGLSAFVNALVPGSHVRVVHCLAVSTGYSIEVMLRSDRRRVVAEPHSRPDTTGEQCSLPLSDLVLGERVALPALVRWGLDILDDAAR